MADLAKPRSQEEAAIVNSRLRKKYPQMYEKSWTDRLKKATQAELKKRKKTKPETAVARIKRAGDGRDASLREALSPAEYKRLVGK